MKMVGNGNGNARNNILDMEKRSKGKEKEANDGKIGDEGQPPNASSVKTGGIPELNMAYEFYNPSDFLISRFSTLNSHLQSSSSAVEPSSHAVSLSRFLGGKCPRDSKRCMK